MRSTFRDIGLTLALAAAYVVIGHLGLRFSTTQDNVTLIWGPTGLALAALILGGRRLWPGVFLGALITNWTHGTPLAPSLCIAVGNTLEAWLGAFLLVRVVHLNPALGRLRDVIGYVSVGVLGCTIIGAGVGVSTLLGFGLAEVADAPHLYLEWWLGGAGGALVLGSLLLVGVRGRPRWVTVLVTDVEMWLLLAALVFTASLAFLAVLPPDWAQAASLIAFPLLAWAGLRLGPRGVVVGAAVWSVLVAGGTLLGPEAAPGDSDVVVVFSLSVAAAITGMLLAAASNERLASYQALEASVAERERLAAQVEHLQRLEGLGMLAGGIAHDFNNLLVPVRANAELLHDLIPADKPARDMLRDIETAAENAADLCQQLLTYAGQRQTTLGPVPLARLVTDMRRLLVASIPKRVRLLVDIEDGLPEVDGDASQLRQVVLNLVVNAAEAIGDRDGRIRLSMRLEDASRARSERPVLGMQLPIGSYVALEVADDGPGMDAATASRVFDPFYTTKFKGRGLGLAAVLGIVKAHEGAIAVSTAPGRGTTMRVLLPPSAEVSIPPEDDLVAPTPAAGLRVLLVDDEPAVLTVAARVLERDGHGVITARDGLDAVEAFEGNPDLIDIVVIDVTMPRLDGPSALRRMRIKRPDLPAVLLSGFDEHGVALTLDGNTGFLKKPFQAAVLCATVRRVAHTAWQLDPVG